MAFDPYTTNPYFQAQYPGMYQMPAYDPRQQQGRAPEFTSIMTGTPQFGLGGYADSPSGPVSERTERSFGNNFGGVNIGRGGRLAMQMGSNIPGLGLGIGAVNVGMRANNLAAANAAIEAMGGEGLGVGQVVGGALGLNSYGTGDYGRAVLDNMRARGRSVPMSTGRPPNRSTAQLAAQRGGGGAERGGREGARDNDRSTDGRDHQGWR